MTKITSLPCIRAMGIILIVLWSLGMKAQTNNSATLHWDYSAGGTYNFNPLTFIPNQGFTGGMDYIALQVVGQNCMTLYRVHFPSLYGGSSVTSPTSYDSDLFLKVSPNPASSLIAIDYDISSFYERADEVQIHNMNGKLLMRLPVEDATGQLAVDVSSWQSATYIVSLYASGKRVLHQKLIVKR